MTITKESSSRASDENAETVMSSFYNSVRFLVVALSFCSSLVNINRKMHSQRELLKLEAMIPSYDSSNHVHPLSRSLYAPKRDSVQC